MPVRAKTLAKGGEAVGKTAVGGTASGMERRNLPLELSAGSAL